MPNHTHAPHDLVTPYLSGTIADNERLDLQRHLDTGCPECTKQLQEALPVFDRLIEAIEPVVPRPEIRDQLLARIKQPQSPELPLQSAGVAPPQNVRGEEIFVSRASNANWRDVGVAGVTARVLYIDQQEGRLTALVRMEPGSVYPPHSHQAAEECLVLEGDFHCGSIHLAVGDYQRIPASHWQEAGTTQNGCLLLVTSPLD